MKKLNVSQIKTIGNFLSNYHSDLMFFKNFKEKIKKDIRDENDEYFNDKNEYSFKKFLNNYGIARRVKKINSSTLINVFKLYNATKKWLLEKPYNERDVMGFVSKISDIKNLTNGINEVSLSSKILFLNNPIEIYPYDNIAKKNLGYKGSDYNIYKSKVDEFKENHKEVIAEIINKLQNCTDLIEKDIDCYSRKELKIIKENRFVDNMLWSGWVD